MRKVITNENARQAWGAIGLVYMVPLDGEPQFLGSGFFITPSGLFVTAKHVANHVIDKAGGTDIGSISAVQVSENGPISRPITTAYFHPVADVAVCETGQFATPAGELIKPMCLTLTMEIPATDTQIATHSFHGADVSLVGEKRPPLHHANVTFSGAFGWDKGGPAEWDSQRTRQIRWCSRVTAGYLTNYFPDGRDSVMLPFPCYESDTPIYGGTSGGPVFDLKGRVFALNCTSFEGSDLSYHTSILPLFDLRIPNAVLPGEEIARSISIWELAALHLVALDSPVACPMPTRRT